MMLPTRILAVEPDAANAQALKQFVQTCVSADVLVVDSVAGARAALAQLTPAVVLVSELVSPDDDVALTAHVRSGVIGRTLPILSVPAMGGGDDDDAPVPRGLLRLIASGGTLADGPRTQMARRQAALRHALQAILHAPPAGSTAAAAVPQRPRAPRWKGDNIPWLTRVTMPLGLEVRLVNISRSGLLIESRGRFVIGQPAAFELHGRLRVVVPGRFVRATASSGHQDLHLSAAIFDDDLPLFAPRAAGAPGGVTITSDLGEVLAWVRGQARSGLRPESHPRRVRAERAGAGRCARRVDLPARRRRPTNRAIRCACPCRRAMGRRHSSRPSTTAPVRRRRTPSNTSGPRPHSPQTCSRWSTPPAPPNPARKCGEDRTSDRASTRCPACRAGRHDERRESGAPAIRRSSPASSQFT